MSETRKRRRGQKATETNILDLPSDVLRQIRNRLSYHGLHSFRLVCKSFQTISDGMVRTLSLDFKVLPSTAKFTKFFSRFPSVTQIEFNSPNIVRALNALADSGLKIEVLKFYRKPNRLPSQKRMISLSSRLGDIKHLTLTWSGGFKAHHVVDFIHMFESLEELELYGGSSWGDVEIDKLSLKATHLRKIKLTGNHKLTERSLDTLSNCVNLEHVSIGSCSQITIQSFCAFIHKMKKLKLVDVPYHFQDCESILRIREGDVLTLAAAISCCENLTHLSIIEGVVTDAFLSVVATSRSPLTSLVYKQIGVPKFGYTMTGVPKFGYTMTGVSAMLWAFHGLTKLHIALPLSGLYTQDTEMSKLVEALVHLKDVSLYSRAALYATLFSMIRNCPFLEDIYMNYRWDIGIRCNMNMPQFIRKNYSIRSIRIYPEPDITIKIALTSICPSLKKSVCLNSIYP